MPLAKIPPPQKHLILIVDDEPDVHQITKLSLRGLRRGRPIEFISASSGEEAIRMMQAHPDVAVILLDVVMETNSAGLDACRAIRETLGNPFVRILLRTGFPGEAPERQTIDEFDIDAYLPKAELTSSRLYAAVRTALKAWEELVELERHRELLAAIHEGIVSLHSFAPLEETLGRILETAVELSPTPLAVLQLETFDEQGNSQRLSLFQSTDPDSARAEAAAQAATTRIVQNASAQGYRQAGPVEGGYLVPLVLHRELGHGWILLTEATPDPLAAMGLPLLAAHASNALYAAVAQALLEGREGSIFDSFSI
jgi:CheY-like chemotaxis protein